MAGEDGLVVRETLWCLKSWLWFCAGFFGTQAPSFNPNPSCRGVEDKHTGGWSGSDIAVIETKWVMDLF